MRIENPICGWDDLSHISDEYNINTKHGKYDRTMNSTAATLEGRTIEAGDIVEFECTDSKPPRKPVVDQADDDDSDGIIRMFCMSPKTRGELGRSDNFKTKYINNL